MGWRLIRLVATDETGQSLAEYGLLTALIAIVTIGAIRSLSTSLSGKFTELATTIGKAS
ncbi:MAG: Flp family type IVb pilin [Firmicutes bacterium]|nr:Flp family type IVb pilin [Bacillota bacterium]